MDIWASGLEDPPKCLTTICGIEVRQEAVSRIADQSAILSV
jgi:hypothetical protein